MTNERTPLLILALAALAAVPAAAANPRAAAPGKAAPPLPASAVARPADPASAAKPAVQDQLRAIGSALVEVGQRLQNVSGAENASQAGAHAEALLTGERRSEAAAEPEAPALEIPSEPKELRALVKEKSAFVERFNAKFAERIVGQTEMRDSVLISILTGGSLLLEANPGLAKTRGAETAGQMLDLKMTRVQFVPDLLPSDITGAKQLDLETGRWVVNEGPIFADIFFADEINRAKTATQSALLEAMAEGKVTIAGQRRRLPEGFFVIATQNPIEQEGTNPLPEAQRDRFLLQVNVDQPSLDELEKVVEMVLGEEEDAAPERLLTRAEVLGLRKIVRRIMVDKSVVNYAARLVKALDPRPEGAPDFVKQTLRQPVGPRAALALAKAARAQAFLQRRHHVIPDDIKTVASRVLRHRVILQFKHDLPEKRDGVITGLIAKLLAHVPAPAPAAQAE